MTINKDYFQNPIVPKYILCKSNKERIGTIKCTSKTHDEKYKDLDEISFTTYMNIDGEKNPYYDAIDIMKYVLLPDIGFFSISSVNVQSEGTEFEYKEVTAKSYECLMGQKYLETFVINFGLTESIDGVQFYNIGDKEHSLLHLVLNLCPEWKIGHVDTALYTKQRSFKVDRQDVYSFLINDVTNAFECVFLFDTLTNTINIYEEKNVGNDTNIHISYNNLLKNTNISGDIDDVKTCLKVTGSDDLTLREVNMGFDKIYYLNPFLSTDYMSKGLYDACNKWLTLRSNYESQYNTLLSQYQNYIKQINELTYTKMPTDPSSTDWTQYGLNPLKEKLAVYEQKQAVSMKAGHGNSSSSFYNTEYLPIYNTINAINAQINVVNSQLNKLISSRDNIENQMSSIMNIVSMENNFTEGQLSELSSFIREDELSSDNFVVTDAMTDDEKFSMLNEMLEYANKEIYKVATPQLTFSVDMVNIYSVPEFEKLHGQFKTGNYIWISLRDDYHIKPRLLTIHTDFYTPQNFAVTFGNISRKSKDEWDDIGELIDVGKSASTSVSFNASYWNRAAKDTDNINKMLEEGLLSAGNYLSSGDDSEMLIDSRGIFVNTTSGTYANKDSIFIGGGRILFTDDAWKTVAMAVGRADVNGESRFGVFADFVIAGYIAGSTVEGTEIYGGKITGTVFNNGNGTFLVDKDGNLTATSATIKGKIQADTGYIGGENGFTITTGKLYSGKNTFNNSSTGVYLGTDGIALGKDNAFSVDSSGNLIAKTGTIGGIKIDSSRIYSDNGNFQITSAGYGQFKDITITGVRAGSSFGSIGYNNGITWGSFGGSSYFGSNVRSPFSGTCVDHIEELAVGQITADIVYARAIETGFITASTIEAEYATIDSLNATNANISSLTTRTVSVEGKITALQGNFDSLRSGSTSFSKVSTESIQMYSGSSPVSMGVITIVDSLGNSYKVVGTAV